VRPDLQDTFDLSNPDEKRRLLSWLSARSGMYAVSAEPKRDTRTLRQNRTFWRLWVQPLHEHLAETDETHPTGKDGREWAKRIICAAVLGIIARRCPVTGRVFDEPKGTSGLSIEEFADFLDRAAVWLAKHTPVVVEDPDPCHGCGIGGGRKAVAR
jgi:NAD-dependent dihydropyrimidine dehydrogenase PreA subunit